MEDLSVNSRMVLAGLEAQIKLFERQAPSDFRNFLSVQDRPFQLSEYCHSCQRCQHFQRWHEGRSFLAYSAYGYDANVSNDGSQFSCLQCLWCQRFQP